MRIKNAGFGNHNKSIGTNNVIPSETDHPEYLIDIDEDNEASDPEENFFNK